MDLHGSGWEIFTITSSSCWILQGSILGPTLDVICSIAIYADDTTLYPNMIGI